MVGVPRSKGCRNCRRKKKGCDLQRPRCGQCARLDYTCFYDYKQWTFVDQRPSSEEPSRSASRSQSIDPTETQSLQRMTLLTGPVERSLNRSPLQSATFAEFWKLWMPQDSPSAIIIQGTEMVPWIDTVLDLSDSNRTVKMALDAVSSTIVGHSSSDPILLQEGRRLYGKALSATNIALQNRTTAQEDAVLASCKLLAMYENYRPTDEGAFSPNSKGFNWHHHIDGTCRILQLRGPQRHVADHGHRLFEETRITAAMSGITRKKSNIFTSHAWYTVPWQASPRTLRDELIDIMVALPELMQQQSAMQAQLSTADSYQNRFELLKAGQSLLNKCIITGESLQAWEAKALQRSSEALMASRSEMLQMRTLSSICASHGYGFLNTCMKYWTCSVLLFSTTWVLHRSVTAAVRPGETPALPAWAQLPAIPAWMNPERPAANIGLNVHNFYQEGGGYWGVAASLFPIGAVCHYYEATGRWDCPEMQYIRELFQSTTLGKLAKDFLGSMANTANSVKGDPAKREEYARMASAWFGIEGPEKAQEQELVEE